MANPGELLPFLQVTSETWSFTTASCISSTTESLHYVFVSKKHCEDTILKDALRLLREALQYPRKHVAGTSGDTAVTLKIRCG